MGAALPEETTSWKGRDHHFRRKFHMGKQLNEKIADWATMLTKRAKIKINIIDGIVGSELNENPPPQGRPVPMDLVIAGKDIVATDSVGCGVMGLDPRGVKYLQLVAERGLGLGDLSKITVLGESIDAVKRKFELRVEELEDPSFFNQHT